MADIQYLVNKPFVVKWVSDKLKGDVDLPLTSPSYGVMIDGKLAGGVVFVGYDGHNSYMHVASDGSRRWITKKLIRMTFALPFILAGCRRVTGLVRTDNLEAQHFDEKLGFKREGIIRKADFDGCDLIVYGMLKEECRWIKGMTYGKQGQQQ